VLRNLSEILEAAGSGLGKVVRSTVFLKNMNDFAAMNQVYGKYFSSARRALHVEVARLPKMSWWKSTLSHWREIIE